MISNVMSVASLAVLIALYFVLRTAGHGVLRVLIEFTMIGAVAGLLIQIANDRVQKWNSSVILVIMLFVALARVGFVILDKSLRSDESRRVRQALWAVVEVVAAISAILLAFAFCRTVGLNQIILAEDNAKWTNAAYFIQEGSTTSLVVNGLGGVLFAYLTTVVVVFRAISTVSGLDLSESTITILSVWTLGVGSAGFSSVLLLRGLRHSIIHHTRLDIERLLAVVSLSLVAFLVLAQVQSFGFLTLLVSLQLIGVASYFVFGCQNRSFLDLLLALVAVVGAALVWLPLGVLLIPFIAVLVVQIISSLAGRRLVVSLVSALAILYAAASMLLGRFRYFQSSGASGQPIWKELLLSPGGTPSISITMALVSAGILILLLQGENTNSRLATFLATTFIVLFGAVQIVSTTVVGDSSYTVSKIGVYSLTASLLVASQVRPTAQSYWASNSIVPLSILALVALVFGGDVTRTSARLVDTGSRRTVGEVNIHWIREIDRRLDRNELLPVGCVSVDDSGVISADVKNDYFCTRALNGIAGGEERLIGLLAHSMGTFNADEMVGSLVYYLGSAASETVMLLAPNGMVSEVVPISELGNRLPNLFDSTSP